MIRRLAAPTLAAGIACLACGGEPEGPRVSVTPTRLEFVREWLRPSLSPETDFVTFPMNVEYDRGSGHLFVQDRDTKTIIEIEESGALVRTFGKEGQGPGEIGHPSEVAVDDEHVIAVDNGNLKILVFRRDASLESEFARLADGRVAVLDADRLDLLLFRPETGETTRIDLMDISLMAAWHEEVAAELRRLQRMGGGRQWIQGQMHRVEGSYVLVTAGPPDLVERGMELWRLDLSSGDIRRYEYGEPLVGYRIDVDERRIFTSHLDTGAIVEYRIPDGG